MKRDSTASLGAAIMSALGHKRTLRLVRLMSALPSKADIVQHGGNVRFVPTADILHRENKPLV
jgi:hypothetical protein